MAAAVEADAVADVGGVEVGDGTELQVHGLAPPGRRAWPRWQRAGTQVVLSLAESIDTASPQRLEALVKLIVEKVPVVDGKVDARQIVWSAPIRPFFESPFT